MDSTNLARKGVKAVDAIADTGRALDVADDIYDAGKAIKKSDDIIETATESLDDIENLFPFDEKTSELLYENAKSRIRHNGVYQDAIRKTSAKLDKSIRNHEKQVQIHIDKIKKPEMYDIDWYRKTENQRKGLLRKWRKDAIRNAEQAEIERRVRNERFTR